MISRPFSLPVLDQRERSRSLVSVSSVRSRTSCGAKLFSYHGKGRFLPCPGGEIGRRNGLKIRFSARRVRVQVPPRAPLPFKKSRCSAFVTHRRRRFVPTGEEAAMPTLSITLPDSSIIRSALL
jgi:hypothetical protein